MRGLENRLSSNLTLANLCIAQKHHMTCHKRIGFHINRKMTGLKNKLHSNQQLSRKAVALSDCQRSSTRRHKDNATDHHFLEELELDPDHLPRLKELKTKFQSKPINAFADRMKRLIRLRESNRAHQQSIGNRNKRRD